MMSLARAIYKAADPLFAGEENNGATQVKTHTFYLCRYGIKNELNLQIR